MFDIGIWEILVLSVVSLIVIGPKDFPVFLRTVGRSIAKIKGIARDFQGTMEDVATDMELDKIRKANQNINNLGSMDLNKISGGEPHQEGKLDLPAPKADSPQPQGWSHEQQ